MSKPHLRPIFSAIEVLESRLVLSVTPLAVGRALDLQEGVMVTLSGNPLAFGTLSLGATGQLFGFPSGGDGDFLILSTGIASQVTTLGNTSSDQGTDFGPEGVEGDVATVTFTLTVPMGGAQRLKLDFMFLSEEFPEFRNAGFNDFFTVRINGVNYAVDGSGNAIGVDEAAFVAAETTFLDGRTEKLTLSYAVPDGVTELVVELQIADAGDGVLDSAVLVDNVRFESPQLVFLDFDGGLVSGIFGAGISALIPAFLPGDIGSGATVEVLIASVLATLSSVFAPYDIQFTVTQPAGGLYTTILVGGDNSLALDISSASPLLRNRFPEATVPMNVLYGLGEDSLLGLSGGPDVGNRNRADVAVVFSGEFDDFYTSATAEERLEHLAITIAHELGHALGLRHVADAGNADEIMKHEAPRATNATFTDALLLLDERWSDGVTTQNSHRYLLSVLGTSSGTGVASSPTQGTTYFNGTGPTLYNVTLSITPPGAAPLVFEFETFNGAHNLPLSAQVRGATITLTAASQPGGPINIFSGTPVDGILTDLTSAVPLFDGNGNLLPIPLAKQKGATFSSNGALTLATNDLGNVTLLPTKVGKFTDADGDTYTIRLRGPGSLGYVLEDPDRDGRGGLLRLVLDDTTLAGSTLIITVKKSTLGDGQVNIGEITGTLGSGLKSLAAPLVNLTGGGMIFSGAVGGVSIRDVLNGADIIAGAAEGVRTTLKLQTIGAGSDVSFGTVLGLLQAVQIGDTAITAPSVMKTLLVGDFGGQLTTEMALGSFSARDLLSTASIVTGGSTLDRSSVAVRNIFDGATLQLASTLSSLKLNNAGNATISAQRMDAITAKGDLAADFSATGRIGKVTARDLLPIAMIIGGGQETDASTLSFRAVKDGATIHLASSITSLTAADIGAASVTAAKVQTLVVRGDVKAGLAGDFRASLTLTGGYASFKNTLQNARITGTMQDAVLDVESIGSLSVGNLVSSSILAGYAFSVSRSAFDSGVFFDGSSIQKLTIKGQLADSFIATKTLGSITAGSVEPSNGGEVFGLLLDQVPGKVAIGGFAYDRSGPAEQSLGDFLVKVV